MKRKSPSWTLLLLGISLVSASAGEPRVKKSDPTVSFYYYFRSSIVANDAPRLRSVSRFPFEVTEPDGSVTRYAKGDFFGLYNRLMAAPAGKGLTMRDLILKKEDLTETERATLLQGDLQIGAFRFSSKKGKCFFVGAAFEPERSTQKTSPSAAAVAAPAAPRDKPAPAAPPSNDVVEIVEEPLVNLAAPTPKALAAPVTPAKASAPKTPIPEPTKERLFRFFWIDFRRAVLDNDYAKIKSLTKFEFETKGPLEDDKLKKFNAREFDLLWPRLLEADPHAWGPQRDSMKELIERREEPTVEELAGEPGEKVTVGIFVFRLTRGRWLFTRAIHQD